MGEGAKAAFAAGIVGVVPERLLAALGHGPGKCSVTGKGRVGVNGGMVVHERPLRNLSALSAGRMGVAALSMRWRMETRKWIDACLTARLHWWEIGANISQ